MRRVWLAGKWPRAVTRPRQSVIMVVANGVPRALDGLSETCALGRLIGSAVTVSGSGGSYTCA